MQNEETMPQQSIIGGADMTIQQIYDMGLNVCQGALTVAVQPVEYLLRPEFGSRYFNPITTFLSCAGMFLVGGFGAAGSLGALSRTADASSHHGFIGLTAISAGYFVLNLVHGVRVYRRMLHPEREQHSEYEGPPLPLFRSLLRRLPLGEKFWPVRIVYEPLAVIVAATVLYLFHILDGKAATYGVLVSVALCLKCWMEWYRAWLHIRRTLDSKAIAALMSKMIQGKATEDDLAKVHMAGFPAGISAQDKAAAVARSAGLSDKSFAHLITPVVKPNGSVAEGR